MGTQYGGLFAAFGDEQPTGVDDVNLLVSVAADRCRGQGDPRGLLSAGQRAALVTVDEYRRSKPKGLDARDLRELAAAVVQSMQCAVLMRDGYGLPVEPSLADLVHGAVERLRSLVTA